VLQVYARLGSKFDLVQGESDFAAAAVDEAAALRALGMLDKEPNGAESVDMTATKLGHAVIVKEDGESVCVTVFVGDSPQCAMRG
jgi:arginyl-tRNA synthetase